MSAVAPTQETVSSGGPDAIRRLGVAWTGLLVVVVLLVWAVPAGADAGPGRSGPRGNPHGPGVGGTPVRSRGAAAAAPAGRPEWSAASARAGQAGGGPEGIDDASTAAMSVADDPGDAPTTSAPVGDIQGDAQIDLEVEAASVASGSRFLAAAPVVRGGEAGAAGSLAPTPASSAFDPGPGIVDGSPTADPAPAAPSGITPPLAPFVPNDGLGWGIVLALCGAASVGFVVRHATLRGAMRDARRSAMRDPLTELANRRLFDEIVAREVARSNRQGTPIAVVLMDLDDFKRVNDLRGHAAGDAVLCAVAETISSRVRSSDLAARLGGDEFAVVLPDCGLADARRLADDLCTQISLAVEPAVTVSVGVAVAPDHGRDAEALLASSDAALYRAKAAGRNRVRIGEAGAARS